jgi:S1-C subfamily serine protease
MKMKRFDSSAITRPRAHEGRRILQFAVSISIASLGIAAAEHAFAADPFLRRTATVDVVEKVGPAVVNITTDLSDPRRETFRSRNARQNDFYRDFLRPRGRTPATQMLGSGVIIDAERHVLTNAHVITGSSRIRVTLADGREFPARLVGAAPNNDLAVLQIETEEVLPWIPTGTSDDLMVGEPVIAIGNPFGLFSNSVTTGVLSAIDRSLMVEGDYYYGFLQTDASINPGNSGGPLLNAEGTLIGINTAIYRGAQGIGLSIPISTANRVIAQLLEHGEIPPPWIGLEFQNLDPALRSVMKLPDGVSGALVTKIEPDSPAETAGLKRGDLVISIDGHKVVQDRSFFEALATSLVGQSIELEIWRQEKIRKIRVVGADLPDHVVKNLAAQFLGMTLSPDVGAGFKINEVNTRYPAYYLGIRAGDIVVGINGRSLLGPDDLRRAMVDLRRDYISTHAQNQMLLVVRRGDRQEHVLLPSIETFRTYRPQNRR